MARFSDAQLIQVLQKSARRINRELCLIGTTDELSVDASGTISPDDQALYDMVLLQAECMIMQIDMNNDFTSAADGAGGGYYVRDGEQALDTRGEVASRAQARTNYLNSGYNPCAELQRAMLSEKLIRCGNPVDIW